MRTVNPELSGLCPDAAYPRLGMASDHRHHATPSAPPATVSSASGQAGTSVDRSSSAKGLDAAQVLSSLQAEVAETLATVIERQVTFGSPTVTTKDAPAAVGDQIHISFKLGFALENARAQGCLLLPLPEAIALANYLMMAPDSVVAARRQDTQLDRSSMDAMLVIGNFIGGAVDSAVCRLGSGGPKVTSQGCQGVRPLHSPLLSRVPHDPLWVATSTLQVHDHPMATSNWMLPAAVFDGLRAAS